MRSENSFLWVSHSLQNIPLFIGVKFVKFSCFVRASFRATSVAIAPKHTHVDEGAKICAAPLLYDVGFVGFSGVGRALN